MGRLFIDHTIEKQVRFVFAEGGFGFDQRSRAIQETLPFPSGARAATAFEVSYLTHEWGLDNGE